MAADHPTHRSKLRAPVANDWVVPRPRLRRRLQALLHRHQLVWVRASAGSGKTTAVADAVAALERPVAWLTLDDTEVAPGRLLVHLEGALREALPDLRAAATDALGSSVPHVAAAGFLAEALADHQMTIVLDEVERLAEAEDARVALAAFVRYLPPTARLVLISRREVSLPLGSARAVGGVGVLSEAGMQLTVEEAGAVLSGLEHADADATEVVRATGGWVAGVLFEAWRHPEHEHGAGGESDALSGYLASEIMEQLSTEQAWLLTATAPLRDVTTARVRALGIPGGSGTLTSLRGRHMPVWFAADGSELRCHPRFREFLRRRLDDHPDVPAVRALHVAHGELARTEQRFDDAVDAFLQAGDLDRAEAASEQALLDVLRRGDVAVAARWLQAFRSAAIRGSELLTGTELTVALDGEQWATGASAADRLLGMLGQTAPGIPLDPMLAGTIGTCFLHMGRFDDVHAVLEDARPGPALEAWRAALGMDVCDADEHYRDRPPDRGDIVDGLLHRLDYMHGRFGRLVDDLSPQWAAARSSRVAALRAVGRHDEALALLAEWPAPERSPGMTRAVLDLLLDVGRVEEARAVLGRAGPVAERSSPYNVLLHRLNEAMLALRADGDVPAARAALERVEESPEAPRRTRVVDQLALWRGLAALLDDDAEDAAQHLRGGLTLMLEWDRLLLVPAAAVYLAEAEWRLGDEDAADRAADHALDAARIQGSDHLLLTALEEFPAVLSRRLDAEADADSPWHRLGRSMRAPGGAGSRPTARVTHLTEFGTQAVTHRGRAVDLRLTRSLEILAYLAAHGGTAEKTDLLRDLFEPGSGDRPRSYLRQALKRLRDTLGDDVLDATGERVRWKAWTLASDSATFTRDAGKALRLGGRARLDAGCAALTVYDRGEYFVEARGEWLVRRRAELAVLATDLRLDAAETAFALGNSEQARAMVDRVLADDPYRESAWRLSMRVAAAFGQDDLVIRLYRECAARLADLPTEPAASTQRLLTMLRR